MLIISCSRILVEAFSKWIFALHSRHSSNLTMSIFWTALTPISMMYGWKVEMKSLDKTVNVFNKRMESGHCAWLQYAESMETKSARWFWSRKMERESDARTLERYCDYPVVQILFVLPSNRHVLSKCISIYYCLCSVHARFPEIYRTFIHLSGQYVKLIVQAVENVISLYLLRVVNALIRAILVSSVIHHRGRLHQPYLQRQPRAQVPQRHHQYHLVLLLRRHQAEVRFVRTV